MGTYCGIRFKDTVLKVKDPMLEKWLSLSTMTDIEKLKVKDKKMDEFLQRVMGVCDNINTMPNTVFDNFKNTVEKLDSDHIKLNIVISCKNLSNEFELLFLFLKRNIVTGELYHSHESECRKVDINGNVTQDTDLSGAVHYYLPYVDNSTLSKEELEDMENEVMFGVV